MNPPTPLPGIAQWYLLDAADRIIAVDPYWDQFALTNNGGGACAARIIGQPLLHFISGDTPRMFMSAVLTGVRLTGKPRQLPYRCDSPTQLRQLEMLIRRLPGDQIRVEHRLLHALPQHSLHTLRGVSGTVTPRRPPMLRCSQCLLVHRPAFGWTEPDQLPAGRHDFVETICPRCAVLAEPHQPAAAARQYPASP